MRPLDAPTPGPETRSTPAVTVCAAAAPGLAGDPDPADTSDPAARAHAAAANAWGRQALAWALLLLALLVLGQVGQRPELMLGSFARMGPGYWPALLALALLGVAALLVWRSHRTGRAQTEAAACAAEAPTEGRPRAAALTLAAVLAFALLAPVAGVALATWLLALLTALAASNRWPQALLVGSALSLLWLLVFVLGLQVPFQLLPPALAAALQP